MDIDLCRLSYFYCNGLHPFVMLSPPKPLEKYNQIWCVSYSHEWDLQWHMFLPRLLGPWGGVKRSNIILFKLQSQFLRFLYQTLFVLTNERYKIYQTAFSFCHLGHSPGVGRWWCPGVKKYFFSNMAISISKIFIPNFVCVLTNKR